MPRLVPQYWHPSGGLLYHWRAWRYRNTLWRPFSDLLAQWLDTWQCPEESLVIVGSSAGYSMPPGWLARFRRVRILEPDPFARYLFCRRFSGAQPADEALDCFVPGGPAALIRAYPDSAFLFSNVIGQLSGEIDFGTWREEWRAAMAGRSWASYHDIISTARPPERTSPVVLASGTALESVLACFWGPGEIPLVDHACLDLAPLPARYGIWRLLPDRYHLVAWSCMTVV